MKRLILSALVLATMASCTKTDTGPESGDNSNSITFGSSIDAATKVRADDATAFENGEAISVYGYRMDAAATTTDFTANLFLTKTEFTFDGTKFSSADAAAIWQVGKAHNFYAYYPTTLTVTNNTTGATAPLTVVASTGIDAANDVMIANVSTPIYDGSKKSANLDFKHVLSKVRFKIKKELTTSMDAELTKIEFKMKSNAGTVNLATGAVTNTAGSVTMSKDVTFDIDNTAATEVPVNWMVLPVDEISDMILTIDGVQMKVTNANSTIATEAGKITSVIITVKSTGITFESSIDPWGDSEKEAGDLEPITPGPILEYGVAPFAEKGPVTYGSTTTSYNTWYGDVAGTHNGANQAETDAYTNEKPYYKFEVAKTDAYAGDGSLLWTVLQGSAADHGDNICVLKHGAGWRIPRISELQLISQNRGALIATGNGFAAFANKVYWSATESRNGNDAWTCDFDYGSTAAHIKNLGPNVGFHVRCIREIPAPTGPILEFGKAPFAEIGDKFSKGATTIPYNELYGYGSSQPDVATVYAKQKPYYKFEIATTKAYNGTDNNKGWSDLQGSGDDRSGNICVQEHGDGWRIPFFSELRLMYENKAALEAVGIGFADEEYWSATHESGSHFTIKFSDGVWSAPEGVNNVSVRCIREIPAPAGPILEFGKAPYAAKGAIAAATTTSHNDKYGEGTGTNGARYLDYDEAAVYAGEPPYHKFEIALENAYNNEAEGGTKSWAALQGSADDHHDNICVQTHGAGWRIPRFSELRLMFENRIALNVSSYLFRGFSTECWSATESSDTDAWYFGLGNGGMAGPTSKDPGFDVRCVREVAP